MGIKHQAVKASGDKGLASEWNDEHVVDSDVDIAQNSWENQVIENLAAAPAGPVAGQVYFDTTLNCIRVYDGTGWSQSNKRVQYWSAPGSAFIVDSPQATAWELDDGEMESHELPTNENAYCSVYLPHGAIVTGAIVYCNNGARTWRLYRRLLTSAAAMAEMASATMNTEDITITNPTIDNQTYKYFFVAEYMHNGDHVNGARITYTL